MKSARIWGASEEPSKETPKKEGETPKSGGPSGGSVSQEEGHIWFYKEVSQSSVQELVTSLHKAAIERQTTAIKLGLKEPLPIHLHIHSYGGAVFAGFAAADAIRRCPVPVHTHIEGGAASAATLFSVAGAHRTIGEVSFILIHQLFSVFWGKYEEFKDEMKNNDLLMARIRKLYEKYTKMSPEQIEDILKRDLWFDAEKALECGLVDEIL